FSPEGGTVKVEIVPEGNIVEIRVEDEGLGVPEDKVDEIFEPFTQVRTSDATEKGGAGLGLTICKSIVDAHHGTIGVFNNESAGATFWIKLPIASNNS